MKVLKWCLSAVGVWIVGKKIYNSGVKHGMELRKLKLLERQ